MAIPALQNEEEVRACLEQHSALAAERTNWQSTWRDIDERFDPQTQGGFYKMNQGIELGLTNFDATGQEGLDRYTAAIAGLTTPRNQRWHGLTVADKDLLRVPAVARWLEHATDRLFACRYAPAAGFEMQMGADIRQGGKYGTAPLWVDEQVGVGLFYNAIHLAQVFIAEDFRGRVDTVHRRFELTARQARQKFGEEALPDKIIECLYDQSAAKALTKFEFLHVICPANEYSRYEKGAPGRLGMPIKSLYIAIDEKCVVRRGAYRKMPLVVSRVITSPGSVYGRSPAMKVLGTQKTLEEIAKTLLRAGHKAVDPPLAFFDDGTVNKLSLKPGGLNPGMVDEFGRQLVIPVQTGAQVPMGMEIQERERGVVRDAFLEQLFQILTNPSDRMTATQVLEMVQKQGVLVAPFAGRHETEKLGPMMERELDILINAGQIDPMPPEMVEAGVEMPRVAYENPLAKMSRAEEAAGFTRWVEVATQLAAFDPGVFDAINTDRAMMGLADVLSVRPSWINTPEEQEAKRKARQDAQQMAQVAQIAPTVAGAALDIARANQVAGA